MTTQRDTLYLWGRSLIGRPPRGSASSRISTWELRKVSDPIPDSLSRKTVSFLGFNCPVLRTPDVWVFPAPTNSHPPAGFQHQLERPRPRGLRAQPHRCPDSNSDLATITGSHDPLLRLTSLLDWLPEPGRTADLLLITDSLQRLWPWTQRSHRMKR